MDHPDLDDEKAFAKAINNALVEGIITEKELRYEFGLSIPTVRRWKESVTAPHPIMRKPVYEWLAERREQARQEKLKTLNP